MPCHRGRARPAPQTVGHRLAKTAARTGIDLACPGGVALAALLLRDAASPGSADGTSVRP
ncbi:hypothetical protein [Streptomyces enissocaesilis]|uniref:hypothetical protein n=1 Tax=Streptomyces enissocaesilis TaxID=332589 RepID=UPI0031D86851